MYKRQVQLGIYPAVDPLASSSRALSPEIVGEEHYAVASEVKRVLQRYHELQDIIAILGICLLYTSDAADDLLCVDLGGRRIIKKKTK